MSSTWMQNSNYRITFTWINSILPELGEPLKDYCSIDNNYV